MAVSKVNGFRAPYKSSTFAQMVAAQIQGSGLLSIDGPVAQSVSTITIPAFVFVQNGLIVSESATRTVASPTSVEAPYHLVVSSPSSENVDNLVFTFAKSPTDLSGDEVIIASYDGNEWRTSPLHSAAGMLAHFSTVNAGTDRTGPYTGLRTVLDGSDFENAPGTLIDKSGDYQVFAELASFPVVAEDDDFDRVDRIVYRRAKDDPSRIGTRKFLLGGAYDPSGATSLYETEVFSDAAAHINVKTLILSDNTALVLASADDTIAFKHIDTDRVTEIDSGDLVTSAVHTDFDAAVDLDDVIHLVYVAGANDNIEYRQFNLDGTPKTTAATVDNLSGDCRCPRIKIDPQNRQAYITYQSDLASSNNQVFLASMDVSSGAASLAPVNLTGESGNNINPDLFVTDDLWVYVTWESAGVIKYRVFDTFGAPLGAAVSVSTATVGAGGPFSIQATGPRIIVTDNKKVFIAFRQKAPTDYGLAVWSNGAASILSYPGSGSVEAFDFIVDEVFGEPVVVTANTAVSLSKLKGGAISFSRQLNAGAAGSVSFAMDKAGALFHALRLSDDSVVSVKSVAEVVAEAFSSTAQDTDVVLSRMLTSDGTILNWAASSGRPAGFLEYIIPYGAAALDWSATASNEFTIGAGLKIADIFDDVHYDVAAGSYPMAGDDALYVVLNGTAGTVTPAVATLALLPWEERIAVIGFVKGGSFFPALLGGDFAHLSAGEEVVFGEDLPSEVRARLGITGETAFQPYTSTIGIGSSDTYPQALSRLDLVTGQNKHVRVVGLYGEWDKTAADTLKIAGTAYAQIPGIAQDRNQIDVQDVVLADGQAAYITLNRASGSPSSRTVSVASVGSLPLTGDTLILARRVGDDLVLEHNGQRVIPGSAFAENGAVYHDRPVVKVDYINSSSGTLPTGSSYSAGAFTAVNGSRVLFTEVTAPGVYEMSGNGTSIAWQLLKVFAGSATPVHGDLVSSLSSEQQHNSLWVRDEVSSSWYPFLETPGALQEDRSAFLRSDGSISWSGGILNFEAQDIILEVTHPAAGGSPVVHTLPADSLTIGDGEAVWVEIDRLAGGTLTPNLSGTTAIPAHSHADKDVIVLFKRVDSGSDKILHIPFTKQAIEDGQTFRLGAAGGGGGGSGSGEINYIPNGSADESTAEVFESYEHASPSVELSGNISDITSPGGGITVVREASTDLRGSYLHVVSKAAGNCLGHGIRTKMFTIAPADKWRRLKIEAEVKFDDVNYVDRSLKMYVYDVLNEMYIDVSNPYIHNITGKHVARFQASDSLEYYVYFHNTSDDTAAWDCKIDEVKVGPGLVPVRVDTPHVNFMLDGGKADICGLSNWKIRSRIFSATADVSENKILYTSHPFKNGDVVCMHSVGDVEEIADGTEYYVVQKTSNDFKLSATPGGSAITLDGSDDTVTFGCRTPRDLDSAADVDGSNNGVFEVLLSDDNPLNGTVSYEFRKFAAQATGYMATAYIEAPTGYRNGATRELRLTVDTSDADYQDGDLALYIFNSDTNEIHYPSVSDIPAGFVGDLALTWEASEGDYHYYLVVYCAASHKDATSVTADDFSVGATVVAPNTDYLGLERQIIELLEESLYDYATISVFGLHGDSFLGTSTGRLVRGMGSFIVNNGETMLSSDLMDGDYYATPRKLDSLQLAVYWDLNHLDTGATYEISRDGGTNYQTISMERVNGGDAYVGTLAPATEFISPTYLSYSPSLTDIDVEMDDDTSSSGQQRVARAFTVSNPTLLTTFDIDMKKTGTPNGRIWLEIVRDDSGAPSTDPDDILISSDKVLTTALPTDYNTADTRFELGQILPAGDYHWILRTDDAYIAEYTASTGANAVSLNGGTSSGDFDGYLRWNGSAWTTFSTPTNVDHTLLGIVVDLRVRVTGSADGKRIRAFGLLYGLGTTNLEVFSDKYRALIDGNFLGSPDADLDKSAAGRGIFLRRPDGTLREITIDDGDNIVVYSV